MQPPYEQQQPPQQPASTDPYSGYQRPQPSTPQPQPQPQPAPYTPGPGQNPPGYYPQSPYPYANPYDPNWVQAERVRAAVSRSYVTPAVITLILYFVAWIPGFIANIIYLASANETKKLAGGRTPEGYGCLASMLIVLSIVPVVFVVLFLCPLALTH